MLNIENWHLGQKTIPAEVAAHLVKSGDVISYGEFVLFPEACDKALADRVNELYGVEVRGTCYSRIPELVKVDPAGNHFILEDYHFSGISRNLHGQNLCSYIPILYHQAPRLIRKFIDYDVVFITTGPMDPRGFFNYGVANSVTSAVLSKAKTIVVEVNENVPCCLGGNQESIHISRVDYVVNGNNNPLTELVPAVPNKVDQAIAGHLLKEIEDGCCLQLGIGGLPNLVGTMLADSNLKDLGIHTEMLTDSCVELYKAGRVTGAKKAIDAYKMTYTFAMGTKKLYEFLNNNPVCASYPVNYTNDPRVIALNDKVFAINNAIEVDLYSQVCSESAGTRQISGTGGQFDFIHGAFSSHGGKGFICLSSTWTATDGTVYSRIKPMLSPGAIVTMPRTGVYFLCTEYGIAQMKGKSTWQRAEAIIDIAHPMFRDELIKSADEMRIWRRSNRILA